MQSQYTLSILYSFNFVFMNSDECFYFRVKLFLKYIYLYFKKWIFCLYIYLCTVCVQCPQIHSDTLKQELQMVVSYCVHAGNWPWFLWKSSQCLNYWATSPAWGCGFYVVFEKCPLQYYKITDTPQLTVELCSYKSIINWTYQLRL